MILDILFSHPVRSLIILSVSYLILGFLYRTSLIRICKNWLVSVGDKFHIYNQYRFPQFNDHSQENQLFRKISAYLKSLPSLEDSDSVTLYSGDRPGDVVVSLDSDRIVPDSFLGARVMWVYRKHGAGPGLGREFVLKIRSRDKKRILLPYIQHIYKVSDELEQKKKDLKVFLNRSSSDDKHDERWRSFPFIHPSSFDAIVLDEEVKNKVKSDLELFLKSKQYYNKIGRVWKRSYLLYGGSGTGKSSFAAAMSKFLSYDLYDIDLSKTSDGSDLKTLLMQTTRRSLILIENLDLFLMGESKGVSLSSVLNFMDGVVSGCGEERVMVFTMNCKYDIDSLALRPGRVDIHIFFPFCDFNGFKALALSHLGLKDHKLYGQIEELFQTGLRLSPAEISEIMISNRTSSTRALKSVILSLQNESGGDTKESDSVGGGLPRNPSSRHSRILDESDGSVSGNRKQSMNGIKEVQKFYGLWKFRNSKKDEALEDNGGITHVPN